MQGLVTLDFGNSHPHAGLFQKNQGNWELIKVVPLNELQLYLSQLDMSAHNTSVVVCEVKAREDEIQKLQEQGFLVTRVKEYWRGSRFAGMPVHYANTLGEDRLIEAFYAYKTQKVSTLIIDAGTFVTMDIVTPSGFMGGLILPGSEVYFSCYEKGEQLKNTELNFSIKHELPQDTASAITESYQAFALLGKKLIQDHQVERVIITGGLAELWYPLFQNENVKVESNPHFIHYSLHYWMTTQIEPL
jgi:pantothenate kinase type III